MKRKNLLAGALLSACVLFSGSALASCALVPETSSSSASNSSVQAQQTEFEKIYAQYVEYAEALGQEPMAYELWLATIRGADGQDGKDGVDGADGKSAYEIWLDNGYEGSEADFLAWLKGEKGDQGEKGEQGEQGIQGEKGEQGEQGIQGEKGEQGEQGIQGEKGEQGEQGIQGDKGDKGDKGDQGVGIEKVECDANGNLIITYTDGSTQTVIVPNQGGHTHTWGDGIVLKEATYTENGVMIYICDCGEAKHEVVKYYSKGLEYALYANGVAYSVTGIGTCTDTDIVIPSTYEGLPVKKIDAHAFESCKSLTRVKIGEAVTNIGVDAFRGCTSLTSVDIGDSVTHINVRAFYYCPSLVGINVSEENPVYQSINGDLYGKYSKKLMQYAIGKTDTSFTIPDSVTSIGDYAFESCKSLTSVEIPDSVTSIGDYAFYNCTSLTSVEIGDSVTSIGEGAFYDCDSLTSVYYKGTAEKWNGISIGSDNSDLTNATKYYYSESKPIYVGDRWHYVDGVPTIWVSQGLAYTLNGDGVSYSVTGIGNCTDRYIIIPSKYNNLPVTSIGYMAFKDCTSLTSVIIPDTVLGISESAFEGCTCLESVVIGDSVMSIEDYAFYDCTWLTSVVLGKSVTQIYEGAFCYCEYLERVYYKGTAEDWKNIVVYAHNNELDDATRYYYSESQPMEEGNWWHYVDGVPTVWGVVISQGLEYALNDDGVSYSITGIGTCADTDIVIPAKYNGLPVTSIGEKAFFEKSLTSVRIPDTVAMIGMRAFGWCRQLKDLVIPDSVTSIGDQAFFYCNSLTSVVIPASVTSIEGQAFSGCKSLTNITVSEDNNVYQSVDGNLYTKKNMTLIQYAIGKQDKTFTIPDSVTGIAYRAFEYCYSLTSVVIPYSVTSIEEQAFRYFYSLTSITVAKGNSVYQSIDGNLYTKDGKTLLQYAIGKTNTFFTIPSTVTTIGGCAFAHCTSLERVVIPESVTSIDAWAFGECRSLTSIEFSDTSNWYSTPFLSSWENKTGGTQMSVTSVSMFTSIDRCYYYWYKL